MALPRYTLTRLLLSILWISVGFGLIKLSFSVPEPRPFNSSLENLTKYVSLVVGWVILCIGVIPLVTTRRPVRVLMLALVGAIPGALLGAGNNSETLKFGWMAVGSVVLATIVSQLGGAPDDSKG